MAMPILAPPAAAALEVVAVAVPADVVVLGGGVIGLTTAVRLLEAGYRVRVVARNFEEGACSRRR